MKKTFKQLQEAIKGWKNAHSDLMKIRQDRNKQDDNASLVRLNKNGSESKMHDAKKTFKSEEEARAHHEKLKKLNPGQNIKHNLYINDKHNSVLE